MDYLAILRKSYAKAPEVMCCAPESKLEWLGDQVFDFTTYDGDMSEFFAARALEVCKAITNGTTFDYIKESDENYRWYLAMCNMPFFSQRIEWGGSIRGAWWSCAFQGKTAYIQCWAYEGDDRMPDWVMDTSEWEAFIKAIIQFAEE